MDFAAHGVYCGKHALQYALPKNRDIRTMTQRVIELRLLVRTRAGNVDQRLATVRLRPYPTLRKNRCRCRLHSRFQILM